VAASLRKDPGINGWVAVVPDSERVGPIWDRYTEYTLTVDSTVTNSRTPDGAPFGLYLYDAHRDDTYTNATFTYWINDTQRSISWRTRSGHSSLWSGPVTGSRARKPDGNWYTPYTWTYTGTIDPSTTALGNDGVDRVWLGHFHVRATIRQNSISTANLTYWAERSITLVRDGKDEQLAFQRRQGVLGPYSGSGARSARVSSGSTATEPPLPEGTEETSEETIEVELPTTVL
jgi:hypothetical protein